LEVAKMYQGVGVGFELVLMLVLGGIERRYLPSLRRPQRPALLTGCSYEVEHDDEHENDYTSLLR
jgi:hypothetical protein